MENGTITLIGATTENPSFHLNNALLSRCRVFVLDKLSSEALQEILQRAAKTMGLGVVDNGKDCDSNWLVVLAAILRVYKCTTIFSCV